MIAIGEMSPPSKAPLWWLTATLLAVTQKQTLEHRFAVEAWAMTKPLHSHRLVTPTFESVQSHLAWALCALAGFVQPLARHIVPQMLYPSRGHS